MKTNLLAFSCRFIYNHGVKFINLKGQKFGRLVVIDSVRIKTKWAVRVYWNCKCECGRIKMISALSLRQKKTRSCGCLHKDFLKLGSTNLKHGSCRNGELSDLYKRWASMIQRCGNPNHKSYHHYGGRGIFVSEEWSKNYGAFKTWSLNNGFKKGLQIDRIDNNDGYYPENCRWITSSENQNNRRNNRVLVFPSGTMTLMQASKLYKIPYNTLNNRLLREGLNPQEAIERTRYAKSKIISK